MNEKNDAKLLNKMWKALIFHARKKRFIAFDELARLTIDNPEATYHSNEGKMNPLLNKIAIISAKLSQSVMSEAVVITAIVTNKELVEHKELSFEALGGFLTALEKADIQHSLDDGYTLARKHKKLTFEWAPDAPDSIPPGSYLDVF